MNSHNLDLLFGGLSKIVKKTIRKDYSDEMSDRYNNNYFNDIINKFDRSELISYIDIHYGNNDIFRFDGTNFSNAPNDELVNDFIKAYKYNIKNGGGSEIKKMAESKKYGTNLKKDTHDGNRFSSKKNTIYWDPIHASYSKEGYLRSPATELEHEGAHAWGYNSDKKGYNKRKNQYVKGYDNAEEERVMKGPEAVTAQKNKEYPKGYYRTDHKDYGEIRVGDPTSTKLYPSKTMLELFKKSVPR